MDWGVWREPSFVRRLSPVLRHLLGEDCETLVSPLARTGYRHVFLDNYDDLRKKSIVFGAICDTLDREGDVM